MAIQSGVGSSKKSNDAFEAGRSAARLALDRMGAANPDLTVVFSSVIFDQPGLLQGVQTVVGKSPLVGCSTAGEISSEGFDRRSTVVMTLKSNKLQCGTGLGEGLTRDALQVGRDVARNAVRKNPANRFAFMMMSDGLKGNGASVIKGVQEVLGNSFPIVGGSAGDDFLFENTYQYYNGQVFNDAVVGVLFGGDVAIGVGARHGWQPLGKLRKITKARENIVEEIDGVKAVEIYTDYFDKKIEELTQEGPLARITIMYPLGMTVPGEEEYLLRNILRVTPAGALVCAGEIPQGAEARLMMASDRLAIAAAKNAAERALKNMGDVEVRVAFVFNSASRARLLGRRSSREIEAIKQVFGKDVSIIGFCTYGEQAPLRAEMNVGRSYFHNETIAILAIGERKKR